MNEWFKGLFTFSHREQRGIGILLGLMILSILFSFLSPYLIRPKKFDPEMFREQVRLFLNDSVRKDDRFQPEQEYIKSDTQKGYADPGIDFRNNPFPFDPNILDENGWIKTGLEYRIIRNILRYREKGGIFRTPADLNRIYGMNDSTFRMLEPYIRIKPANPSGRQIPLKGSRHTGYEKLPFADTTALIPLELNTADSSSLTVLPGIGPSFASRIIRYRNLLGGYTCKEQLLEVNGMDSIRFIGIMDLVRIDSSRVKKMKLNQVTFKQMVRHPYFEYHLVRAIFSYRDRIKSYDSVEQIKQIDNMYQELYDKISPYLEVGHAGDE